MVVGLAGGLEVGAGAPGGKKLPRGIESPGLWCVEDGGHSPAEGSRPQSLSLGASLAVCLGHRGPLALL